MNQYFIKNNNIKSNIKENSVSIKNINYKFYTDNGLFNKKGLDLGTRILLENFESKEFKKYLDLGCGCGPIGIYLSLIDKDNVVDMIDINENAVKLVKKSLKLNKITNANSYVSDGFENVKNKYDAILFNPPIHAGKNAIYKLINDSKKFLNKNGELWIVIRKKHGAESLINDFKTTFHYELVKKDHGFWIIKFY